MADPWKEKRVIGDATLYLGDAIEVLRGLRDGCQNGDVSVEQGRAREMTLKRALFDAVITDPPYGVELGNHGGSTETRSGYLRKSAYEGYDDTRENFLSIVIPAVKLSIEISGRGVFFCAGKNMWDFPRADAVGGVYLPSACGRHHWGFSSMAHCLFYGRAPDLNKGSKHTVIRSSETAEESAHPCPKPVGWMVWAVDIASRKTETVLDPFMGSGTTGVACMNLGRRFVGIEIEPKYYEIACERITNAQRQQPLFDAKPQPKAEQGGLFNDAA